MRHAFRIMWSLQNECDALANDLKTSWMLCSALHEYMDDENQQECMLENLLLTIELTTT